MFPCIGFGYGLWWLFPIVMIVLMGFCLFMMRGHSGPMMCRPGLHRKDGPGEQGSEPARMPRQFSPGKEIKRVE